MDFDLQWLLLALPVTFGLGWLASRWDWRQMQRDEKRSPRTYFKGLTHLLNEEPDQAIDAFIEVVQNDPDTRELHFALGSLFRKRGEFERAVRVHQHLLQRSDLPPLDRERAQFALAQDYMKAGFFDRAEAAFTAVAETSHANEARMALLHLHERARDWSAASEVATQLEQDAAGSFAQRRAHYECEKAQQAEEAGHTEEAQRAIARARTMAPNAPRPLVEQARQWVRAGRHAEALAAYQALHPRHLAVFALVADEFAQAAIASGDDARASAHAMLSSVIKESASIDVLRALARLEGVRPGELPATLNLLRARPALSVASEVLNASPERCEGEALKAVRDCVAQAALPLQRYRCAACGFEAARYFWQCPGCLAWDSFPPQRLEDH